MANKDKKRDQDGEGESLTEEQRLSLLERSVNLNRIITLVVTVIIIASLSVSVTLAIVRALDDDREILSPANILRMETRISTLESQLKEQQIALSNTPTTPTGTMQNAAPPAYDKLAKQVNETLIDQELRLQQVLRTLKDGMRDLAHMVPGSRTWLERYTHELNEAQSNSEQRLHLLRETPAVPGAKPSSTPKKTGS